jgi:hypothetical protein
MEPLTLIPDRSKCQPPSITRPDTNMEPMTGPLAASSAPRSNKKLCQVIYAINYSRNISEIVAL